MVGDAAFLIGKMPRTAYVDISELTELETSVMVFVIWWVHEKKTPVPQKKIADKITKDGGNYRAVLSAVQSLLRKGYIRRTVVFSSKEVRFVQLRSL